MHFYKKKKILSIKQKHSTEYVKLGFLFFCSLNKLQKIKHGLGWRLLMRKKYIFTQQGNWAKVMVYTVSVQVRTESVCFYFLFLSDVSPSCMLFLISKLQGDIPPVHAIIYNSQKGELFKYSALTWLILNKGYSALTSSSGRSLCCLLAWYKCRKARF